MLSEACPEKTIEKQLHVFVCVLFRRGTNHQLLMRNGGGYSSVEECPLLNQEVEDSITAIE